MIRPFATLAAVSLLACAGAASAQTFAPSWGQPVYLDAWGRPLVYVCQALPGVRGTTTYPWFQRTYIWAPEWYGLAPIGRAKQARTIGPAPAIVAWSSSSSSRGIPGTRWDASKRGWKRGDTPR